jgi:hypothetical protein
MGQVKGRASEGRKLLPALAGQIERRIVSVRGHRVILDADLARLYGVATKRLNEQVRRNANRFPANFAFQISPREGEILRSQFATSSSGHGGRRHRPYAFTEHGAIMAATVLNSPRAVEFSLWVVRAFVRLRRALADHKDQLHKLLELERRVGAHGEAIRSVISALRTLLEPPDEPQRERIGFHAAK